MNVLEEGSAGLFYLTDTAVPGVFVAAPTPEEAREIAADARIALARPDVPVRLHSMHERDGGHRITIPEPDWMTPDQRGETIERLVRHLRAKFSN